MGGRGGGVCCGIADASSGSLSRGSNSLHFSLIRKDRFFFVDETTRCQDSWPILQIQVLWPITLRTEEGTSLLKWKG